jgi:hypothetical protein
MAPGVGRLGIADLIPGLGAWVQETRQNIQRPFLEQAEQRALGLLGTEGTSFEDFGRMGGPAQDYDQVQEATGLMADPTDFYNQMRYATGLMATPFYQQAGQQFAGQFIANQLGLPQRLQEQRNWQAEYQQRQDNWQADQQRRAAEAARNLGVDQEQRIFERANTLRDDYTKAAEPYRQALETYSNVQAIFANRGPESMTTTDDTALIKAYAKILLPNEAVMQDDVAAIAASDDISSVFRGFASRINAKMPLEPDERRELYQAITELSGNQLKGYNQLRADYRARAERATVLPADVMRSQMQIDQANYGGQTPPEKFQNPPVTDPELLRRIEEADRQQNPPGFLERAWDALTDPLVEGWGQMRR